MIGDINCASLLIVGVDKIARPITKANDDFTKMPSFWLFMLPISWQIVIYLGKLFSIERSTLWLACLPLIIMSYGFMQGND